MAAVLTVAGTVSCLHGGSVTPFKSSAKLSIGGSAVTVLSQVAGWAIVNCKPTAPNSKPCTKVPGPPTAGVSAKLTAGGSPVLLGTLSAVTDGTSQPATISAQAGQAKLTAS